MRETSIPSHLVLYTAGIKGDYNDSERGTKIKVDNKTFPLGVFSPDNFPLQLQRNLIQLPVALACGFLV